MKPSYDHPPSPLRPFFYILAEQLACAAYYIAGLVRIELGLYGVRQLVYLLAYSSVILTTVAVGAFLCTLSMPAMQLALAL